MPPTTAETRTPSTRLEKSEAGSSAKAEGGRGRGRGLQCWRRRRRGGGERDSDGGGDDEDANGRGAAAGRCRPRAALQLGVSIRRAASIASEEKRTDAELLVDRETSAQRDRSGWLKSTMARNDDDEDGSEPQ